MDWPTATVICGVLGTIATALVKLPHRKSDGNGRYYATAVDMAKALTELETLKVEMKGVRTGMHELRNDFHSYVLGRRPNNRQSDGGS